jgi:hypothetical protein
LLRHRGSEGRQSRTGARPGDRSGTLDADETLKASGPSHCEARVEKVMSGGAVKAGPRYLAGARGSESGRGDRVSARDNTRVGTTDFDLEQRPEGGAGRAGTSGATRWEAKLANDKRERPGDESGLAESKGKPLKRESCTWQWDETSPQSSQRSKPSRSCETTRTERRQRRKLPNGGL